MTKELHNIKSLARPLYSFSRSLLGPTTSSSPCYHDGLGRCARRYTSSASSARWKARQTKDPFIKTARTSELRSRAALKLAEINEKYKLMKPGMTVVDLGYAPGSWSQVAVHCTSPGGRVLGVDVIPVAPPKGASSIQGDFLSPSVQAMVRRFLSHPDRGRPTTRGPQLGRLDDDNWYDREKTTVTAAAIDQPGYIDQERHETEGDAAEENTLALDDDRDSVRGVERDTVDVVLSDMCEPWEVDGLWKPSILTPWGRMMNVSGIRLRDHVYSLNLCYAALKFCVDVLKPGGSFVCKFYKGDEEKELEKILQQVFRQVVRVKPEASRDESKEEYFVAMRKQPVKDTTARAISNMVQ